MADSKVRKIVIAGVLSAVSLVLGITRMGYIPWFAGAAITIQHVPVIIGAILEGPVVGMIIGFIFGITSLVQAAISPTGPIDIAFTNPIISVLPRILIGVSSWLAYKMFNGKREPVSVPAAATAGSVTNSVLVLGLLGIFKFFPWAMIGAAALANAPLEAAAAVIIATAVVLPYKMIITGRKTSGLPDIEENDAAGD